MEEKVIASLMDVALITSSADERDIYAEARFMLSYPNALLYLPEEKRREAAWVATASLLGWRAEESDVLVFTDFHPVERDMLALYRNVNADLLATAQFLADQIDRYLREWLKREGATC